MEKLAVLLTSETQQVAPIPDAVPLMAFTIRTISDGFGRRSLGGATLPRNVVTPDWG